MKVAMVKQALDVFGPWSSMQWKDTDPRQLFAVWPGKATLWEMTCLLQADWYVVSGEVITDYHHDLIERNPGFPALVRKYVTGVVDPGQIPLGDYDIVISHDPILSDAVYPTTVMAYFLNEHWDVRYNRSLARPIGKYDLFLAHMMDAQDRVTGLPQGVSFPYLRDPLTVRRLFESPKDGAVWVDWRTLTTLGMADLWAEAAVRAARRLEDKLGIPVRHAGEFARAAYGVADPPRWGDAASYLAGLAGCQYYVSLGRIAGAGQGLCDAISLGCICFGQQDKVYHRLACHPACLCGDMADLPAKFRRVAGSSDLQEEIVAWQNDALSHHFVDRPLSVLEEAIEAKRR